MNLSSEHIFIREISSQLNSVSEVESLINEFTNHFSLSDELTFKIQVSLIEAVNNAILHGNSLGVTKTVIITIVNFKSYIRCSIKDEGEGFNYNNAPNPLSTENMGQPNGRGLFLITKLCDTVTFFDRGRIIQMDFEK